MLDVKKLLTKILDAIKVDFIVEEGTKGSYGKYRKWNSGKCEFWYAYDVTGVTTQTWSGVIAYMDTTTFSNIWNGVFNAAPSYVSATANNSQFFAAYPFAWTSTGISSFRYLSCGTKSGQTVHTSMYAVGTWK